ncbi:MBL fold metallo-hydrolase [bacterium]|nr:MBL fold metallo-hydrolase [bacterium]
MTLYAGLALAHLRSDLWSWGSQCRWLSVWINVGLAWGLLPSFSTGLTCEIVAVGHGLAVVMHSADGRTLLYDAGSLAGPDIATEAVSQALWSAGQTQIDACIISHADADHCNGLPGLTERFECGTLLTHPTFARHTGTTVQHVLTSWSDSGGVHHEMARGDRILWSPDVQLSVIHPASEEAYSRDNANSLVILVEYAGRRVLLTGDLEREGLEDVLRLPREAVDLVISPHHGSRNANPPEFGAWTNPVAVIVSGSNPSILDGLQDRYPPETRLWSTATSGRIRCHITAEGELTVQPFR